MEHRLPAPHRPPPLLTGSRHSSIPTHWQHQTPCRQWEGRQVSAAPGRCSSSHPQHHDGPTTATTTPHTNTRHAAAPHTPLQHCNASTSPPSLTSRHGPHPHSAAMGTSHLHAVCSSRPHAVSVASGPVSVSGSQQHERGVRKEQPGAPAWQSSRRHVALGGCVLTGLALAQPWLTAGPAQASKLPVFADNIWEALGGGPSDLVFPPSFLGTWDVTSTLVQVDVPLGDDLVPDMTLVNRARSEDLNQPINYQVSFMRSPRGNEEGVIFDRAFNMASMLSFYMKRPTTDFLDRIEWNAGDPNVLQLSMPGGMSVRTRVTRRSQEDIGPDRLDTSEFLEQVFDSSELPESSTQGLRVKASQCFTKFKWRAEKPGQPAIVATQVVSDYLTPTGSNDAALMKAMNKPVVVYTYRIAFTRATSTT